MAAEFSTSEDNAPIGSINVTPFVDGVLVLLVIFMVTAPVFLKQSIAVKLPKASSGEEKIMKTLGVAVTEQGQILLNGQLTNDESLSTAVKEELRTNPEAQAMISADIEARHGDVVRVIDLIKSAGLNRFALQVEHRNN